MTAAHLLNRFSGQTAPEFVKSRIFSPLNMSSSTLDYYTAAATSHVCHVFDPNGRRIPTLFEQGFTEVSRGPGGVISNVVDLAKWLRFLLGASGDGQDGSIPWNVVSECWKPYAIVPRPNSAPFEHGTLTYGMGWYQGMYQGYQVEFLVQQ
jgi:CubicO group peptidase (beta-lactamase class C family)